MKTLVGQVEIKSVENGMINGWVVSDTHHVSNRVLVKFTVGYLGVMQLAKELKLLTTDLDLEDVEKRINAKDSDYFDRHARNVAEKINKNKGTFAFQHGL